MLAFEAKSQVVILIRYDFSRFKLFVKIKTTEFMDLSALTLSTGVVALAEMGDKTQLLSLMLAARYPKQALAIIGGILIATIANHACAALLGHWLTTFMSPDLLKWILGLSFLGIGLWLLVPDHIDDAAGSKVADRAFKVFILTVGLFFLAEMGDKTQIATIALGAKYSDVFSVTVGTTLGMMLANAPAVWIGQKFTKRMPIKWVHAVAAVTFIAIGIATLIWG
jgi:putative Ca2+/H+ antiporter (TMEM165/GDT1 family)